MVAIVATAVASLLGAITGKYLADNEVLLVNVVYGILSTAESSKIIASETVERTHSTITVNMVVGVAGVFSLLTAFSVIAIRARSQELAASRLQPRLNDLQLVTICGALLLVFLVVVGKTLVAWPQGLMGGSGRTGFGHLAASVVNSWGASGTAILLCALLPAFFSLKADIHRAASRESGGNFRNSLDWIQANKLEFAPMPMISTAIVSAAPMLTGPAMDIASSLVR